MTDDVREALDSLAGSVREGTAAGWEVQLVRARYEAELVAREEQRQALESLRRHTRELEGKLEAAEKHVHELRQQLTGAHLERLKEPEPSLRMVGSDVVSLLDWRELRVVQQGPGGPLRLFLDGREVGGLGSFTVEGEAGCLVRLVLRSPP